MNCVRNEQPIWSHETLVSEAVLMCAFPKARFEIDSCGTITIKEATHNEITRCLIQLHSHGYDLLCLQGTRYTDPESKYTFTLTERALRDLIAHLSDAGPIKSKRSIN